MTIRIGDAVFIRQGLPGVVKDRDEASGKLVLDLDRRQVQADMRHGYVNGLSEDVRGELYAILDEVKASTKDPRERAEALLGRVRALEEDPTKLQLTRYLRAETYHIMNTHNIRPREYSIHETKTR